MVLYVLHRDEVSTLKLGDFVDLANVGMGGRSRALGLGQEPVSCLTVLLHFVRQEFQGHFAVEYCIVREVNSSHASLAQFFKDGVVRNFLSDHLFAYSQGGGEPHCQKTTWTQVVKGLFLQLVPAFGAS